ncbi:Trk system potassium transporter TrkA [Streptococcus himalayensis]|uniref:Trk system potassium uptake protein TrkA n=1 Tax=Streptococcus himalayensis TaxID=1888195 RepID=A0A917EGI4_9STRE|nr:Trk system potassium transporter TrkA [Streptococcus himalayensis]GGE31378.1 Trk system potassium transport protein TrkA [Streptococcus himalayensis]
MKIILVGGGKVGSALCRSLVAEKHDVVLIEQNESVLNHLTKRYDIMGIVGNGADFKMLEQADVKDCDIFIAMTEYDEVNMISSLLAKKMGAKETIVRVRNPEYSNPFFKKKNILGFSLIVNPELLTARYIANIIDFPNALSVERFANGRVSLMEFKVTPGSKLCDITLAQFRKKFGNVLICAMRRGDDLFIPNGDITILPEDIIFVTGNRKEVLRFHNYMRPKSIKSLMLIGAGKISYYLLNILQHSKIDLKLIELKEEQARLFSQEFPHLHVVHGDGTAKDILMEERAQHYDAVATLTGVDEENIIASMFLENLGVQKNITKVNRTSLLEIIDKKNESSIVTPKRIAIDTIMHFIRGRVNAQYSDLQAMHHIANGQIETLQFQIIDDSPVTNLPLAQLSFKPGVLIAAVIRNGKTIFPTGDDQIKVGDQIVVTTLLQNITQVLDLLEE